MKKRGLRWARITCGVLLGAVVGVSVAAAEPEFLGAAGWPSLQAQLPRPAVVVFTATRCAVCPRVIATLQQTLRVRGVTAPVVAVVMDGRAAEPLPVYLQEVDRMVLLDADEAVLRYRVDPHWRGVLPYVALLGEAGEVSFVAGAPSPAQIDAWLAGRGASTRTKRSP